MKNLAMRSKPTIKVLTKGESAKNSMKNIHPDYYRIHKWIRDHHGPATKCIRCHVVGKKRYEWALISGKEYEKNIENYIQLCVSCHRKYDMNDVKRDLFRKNVLSAPIHNRCRAVIAIHAESEVQRKFISVRLAAAEVGYTHGGIIYAINKKTMIGGYYWKYESVE